jgi:pimeloyl-ACP methyl ester carboxylesterase
MSDFPLMPGLSARDVETSRLRTHVIERASPGGTPVVLVHGNAASSRFFEDLMLAVPPNYWVLAPDLRGYGESERKPIDATRGPREWSEDLHALFTTLAIGVGHPVHLLGWSLGGGVVMQYALDHPEAVASLTLVSPVSPYGFGGTKDAQGTLCWPDAAGSGGGTVNPEFVQHLSAGDRGADSPNSPRNVMNAFYFKPPFRGTPDREEVWVESLLQTAIGEDYYPGDATQSTNWPMTAPGRRGGLNALTPKYAHLSAFADLAPRPPVLWVRGADDQIVSDTSFFDLGYLGQLGAVPGWPGAEVYPPQPMLAQMRAVLDRYRANGGSYEEMVIADAGHSPFVEKPGEFQPRYFAFLAGS